MPQRKVSGRAPHRTSRPAFHRQPRDGECPIRLRFSASTAAARVWSRLLHRLSTADTTCRACRGPQVGLTVGASSSFSRRDQRPARLRRRDPPRARRVARRRHRRERARRAATDGAPGTARRSGDRRTPPLPRAPRAGCTAPPGSATDRRNARAAVAMSPARAERSPTLPHNTIRTTSRNSGERPSGPRCPTLRPARPAAARSRVDPGSGRATTGRSSSPPPQAGRHDPDGTCRTFPPRSRAGNDHRRRGGAAGDPGSRHRDRCRRR